MAQRALLPLVAAGILACSAAQADMAISDLTKVDTSAVESQGWVSRKAPERLTLMCTTACTGEFVATDILLGRAPDDTEKRVRSGQTTAQTMLDVCKANAAKSAGTECYGLDKADVKGAVGFVSDISLGKMGYAATYVIWQDGQQLTIRNIAPTREKAKANGALMFKEIAPQIVN